jgi:flagellar hook assembly protein FlgD
MAREGQAKVAIFDVNGRLVKTVFDGIAKEGPNQADWNGLDASGRSVSSGVYFIQMSTLGERHQTKMVLIENGGR